MGDSGHLMSAPAGAFPSMMSQEMPSHNFKVYHTAALETETFSPQCRASVRAGTTFPGQHHAFSCSLEQAVSSTVVSSAHPAARNSSISTTIADGVVGQKQLPGEITAEAVSSETTSSECVGLWSSSVMSHVSQHLATHATLAESPAVASTAAQTTTVTVTCTKPVSSSNVLCHQQYVPQMADEKVLPCLQVNFDSEQYSSVQDSKMVNQQLDRADDVVSGGSVKVEPKVEIETRGIEVSEQPLSADVSVDVTTEQLKHSMKSEVSSEEIVDHRIQNAAVKLKHSDAAVPEQPECNHEMKKESRRKGTYYLLPVYGRPTE